MLTEAQAKEKWCPFARTTEKGDGRYISRPRNRVADGNDMTFYASNLLGCRCIASECMAWRWWDGEGLSKEPNSVMGAQPINAAQRRGYCGLAGQPVAA